MPASSGGGNGISLPNRCDRTLTIIDVPVLGAEDSALATGHSSARISGIHDGPAPFWWGAKCFAALETFMGIGMSLMVDADGFAQFAAGDTTRYSRQESGRSACMEHDSSTRKGQGMPCSK